MSKRILIDTIDLRVKDQVPEITLCQMWNNQILNEGEEAEVLFPVVYIELSDIVWKNLSKGCQRGEVMITIRVVIEKYEDDNRDHLDLVDKVYKSLQLHSQPEYSSLIRLAERQDVDHGNCIVWEIDFKTELTDVTASTDADKTLLGVVPALQIDSELDIDDQIIRTGDGVF